MYVLSDFDDTWLVYFQRAFANSESQRRIFEISPFVGYEGNTMERWMAFTNLISIS